MQDATRQKPPTEHTEQKRRLIPYPFLMCEQTLMGAVICNIQTFLREVGHSALSLAKALPSLEQNFTLAAHPFSRTGSLTNFNQPGA